MTELCFLYSRAYAIVHHAQFLQMLTGNRRTLSRATWRSYVTIILVSKCLCDNVRPVLTNSIFLLQRRYRQNTQTIFWSKHFHYGQISTFALFLVFKRYFFCLAARWDRAFPICWWIFILGCLPNKHDDRWYMGWSRDSPWCGDSLWNMYSRDQQSAASQWRHNLPRVWWYW